MKKMLKRLCTGFLALATVVTALPTIAAAMACATLVAVPHMAQAQPEAQTNAKKDVQVIAFQHRSAPRLRGIERDG